MVEIHSYGACHGDIKPENILITDGYKAVLCDLDSVDKPVCVRTIGTEHYAPPIGLVKEGIHMAQTNEVSWFELYAMLDLYAVGCTIQVIMDKVLTKDIHKMNFWETIIRQFTDTNIKYFFSDGKDKLIRAADCLPVMDYYNIEPFSRIICDCAYRPEWQHVCVLCSDTDEDDQIRRVESVANLGLHAPSMNI